MQKEQTALLSGIKAERTGTAGNSCINCTIKMTSGIHRADRQMSGSLG